LQKLFLTIMENFFLICDVQSQKKSIENSKFFISKNYVK